MSRTLPSLDPWPAGKPLPAGGITIIYDPATDQEYRIDLTRLGGTSGASTNYFKEVYTAKDSGAQTITSADVPGLDTAALVVSVGVRGVDAQGTVTLDGVSSDNYFLSQGVLTIKTDADIDQDDVLEINFITAGQLAAAGLSVTQLAQLLQAGSGISINPTPDGKLLITSTLVTAPVGAPRAPTDGQVDDTADTFSFLPNPSYPAAAQYRVVGRPGVTGAEQLDATNSYVSGNRIVIKVVGAVAKNGLAVYVAGSGSVPDGAALTNGEPFTGAVVTPPPTATTPDAPFPSFDPNTRTLTYQHALGTSELEINHLGGSYQPYAPVSVDDGSHNAGEWKARVKAYLAGNRNASGSADSPAIAAKATVNQLPVANAGDDLSITAPSSSAALMGKASDPDSGDTLTYAWRQITGPNAAIGMPATSLNVVVSGLAVGTYQFGFVATDQKGGKSQEDFVVVTVQAAPATGGNQIICVGDSFTEYTGNMKLPDGSPDYSQGYPALTNARLTAAGRTEVITRFGYPGYGAQWLMNDTSFYNGVTPIDYIISTFQPGKKVILVIFLGLNSLDYFDSHSLTAAESIGYIKQVHDYFRAHGAAITIASPLPNSINSGHPSGNDPYRLPFNDALYAAEGTWFQYLVNIQKFPMMMASDAPTDTNWFQAYDEVGLSGSHGTVTYNMMQGEETAQTLAKALGFSLPLLASQYVGDEGAVVQQNSPLTRYKLPQTWLSNVKNTAFELGASATSKAAGAAAGIGFTGSAVRVRSTQHITFGDVTLDVYSATGQLLASKSGTQYKVDAVGNNYVVLGEIVKITGLPAGLKYAYLRKADTAPADAILCYDSMDAANTAGVFPPPPAARVLSTWTANPVYAYQTTVTENGRKAAKTTGPDYEPAAGTLGTMQINKPAGIDDNTLIQEYDLGFLSNINWMSIHGLTPKSLANTHNGPGNRFTEIKYAVYTSENAYQIFSGNGLAPNSPTSPVSFPPGSRIRLACYAKRIEIILLTSSNDVQSLYTFNEPSGIEYPLVPDCCLGHLGRSFVAEATFSGDANISPSGF